MRFRMPLFSHGHLYLSMALWVSLRLLLLILPLSGYRTVRCRGRAKVRTITIDSNFSVTPGLPKLVCPKSKDPHSCAEAQLWDRRPQAGRLGGLNWPPVPLARPAGLSTDPQAAGGWWSRRGLERAVGTHPLPNTPSTRPAPGKGRGGNQRDLDRGWGCDRRGKVRGCHYFGEGVGASWSPFPLMRRLEGCLPIMGLEGVARTIWEEHWGPGGRGSKKRVGAPGDWGIEQLRRWLKQSKASGTSSSSSPPVCLGPGSRVTHLLLSR